MAFDAAIGFEARSGVKLELTHALNARAEAVCSADAAVTAAIMESALALGDIALGLDGMEEMEAPEDADGCRDDEECDIDLGDEDAAAEPVDVPRPREVYAIRISRAEDGSVRAEPPYSEWAGAIAKTAYGMRLLAGHSKRFDVYRTIARFLVREYPDRLALGPGSLALGLVQKDFAGAELADSGIDASELSRFLHNCDLVWDADVTGAADVSMPLRGIFRP